MNDPNPITYGKRERLADTLARMAERPNPTQPGQLPHVLKTGRARAHLAHMLTREPLCGVKLKNMAPVVLGFGEFTEHMAREGSELITCGTCRVRMVKHYAGRLTQIRRGR